MPPTPDHPDQTASSSARPDAPLPSAPERPIDAERYHRYWRANLRLIGCLLVIWAAVSLGLSLLLAPWLNQWELGSLPLGFWWAQQGSIVVFVVLVFVYAWRLDRLDRKYGVRE